MLTLPRSIHTRERDYTKQTQRGCRSERLCTAPRRDRRSAHMGRLAHCMLEEKAGTLSIPSAMITSHATLVTSTSSFMTNSMPLSLPPARESYSASSLNRSPWGGDSLDEMSSSWREKRVSPQEVSCAFPRPETLLRNVYSNARFSLRCDVSYFFRCCHRQPPIAALRE